MKTNRTLRRMQLDNYFEKLKKINLSRPKKGWIREIRESLGMSMNDLGNRVGTIKQGIERFEKEELLGKVTLETLGKIAVAMDCDLVYFLVPKTKLTATIDKQAELVAKEISLAVEKTMALENQSTSPKYRRQGVEIIKGKILVDGHKKLWKKK